MSRLPIMPRDSTVAFENQEGQHIKLNKTNRMKTDFGWSEKFGNHQVEIISQLVLILAIFLKVNGKCLVLVV
jgi:hypothetical protein